LLFWPGRSPSQAAQHGSFLSWSAPAVDSSHSAAASYNVYRSTVSGGPYTLLVNVTTTSYTDPIAVLTPGTTYYYVVRAVNSVGVEFGGAPLEASGTIPNAPGAVTGIVDVVK
jgi:fibronectin type 3 domain-containing protein